MHDHYFCAVYLLNTLKKSEGFAEKPWEGERATRGLNTKAENTALLKSLVRRKRLAEASKPANERFTAVSDFGGTLRFILEQRENRIDLAEIEF